MGGPRVRAGLSTRGLLLCRGLGSTEDLGAASARRQALASQCRSSSGDRDRPCGGTVILGEGERGPQRCRCQEDGA